MNKRSKLCIRPTVLVTLMAAAWATPSWASEFEMGDGWTGNWSSSISLGSSWRTGERDSKLYGQGNGALIGLTNGTGANTIDEGNLNYDKGDRFTTQIKLFSEFEGKKGTMGFLVRGKAWYDDALKNGNVKFGSQNNGYQNAPLTDSGFETLNKFSGVYLLDAYVYDTFTLAGQPLQVRAGNQVVNWGESLFIQGVNTINPIDVPAFRKPGAQLKEVFLPVPIIHASQSLGEKGTVEAFWQTNWKNTPVEAGCGNYWAVASGNIGSNPGPCNSGVTLTSNSPSGIAANAFVPTIQGKDAKNAGEFGLAYRFNAEKLDTEFGLYATNLHSRLPIISVQKKGSPDGNASPFSVFWEYPENIKTVGISAATNVHGWSIGAELSHAKDVPVQVDGNDLLLAGLAAGGAMPFAPGASVPFGPYGSKAVAAFAGNGYLPGYTLAQKTQIQLNAVKVGRGILAAEQYLFIAEVGFQANNLPDYKKDPTALRYGRPFIFGPGTNASYGGTCAGNINAAGCENDGYITKNAWGYRLKGELTYTDLIPGVTVYPSLYWSHDVSGYSLDGQFSEGRQSLAPSVRFSYAKKYTLELGAVFYNRNAKYDPLRDRDSFSMNVGMSF
jgi:hypothetical protein